MDMISLNLLLYPIFIFVFLISILGHGNYINNNIFKEKIDLDFKNLIFIKGLFSIGFICILINFFTPISDLISFLVIITGGLLYLLNFIKNKNKLKEIFFLIFVFILCFFFSFYAGINDDFQYHYETIKNFKNKDIFNITHQRMVSYNSHWLFLNSIFSFSIFTSSLFVLSSLFFSITIFDLINLSRTSYKKNNKYLSLVSLFSLIFFLGVLNKFKDFGTDIPGVIISLYVMLILFYYFLDKNLEISYEIFSIILILCLFAFIIKITNVLIFLFIIFLFFKLNFKKINYGIILFSMLFPIPWFLQNIIISKCLIWPISLTCFSNIELAVEEEYLIESFAKGDISTSIQVNGFGWIKIWFYNHFSKIFENYFLFFLILILPLIIIKFKKGFSNKLFYNFIKKQYLDLNYLIFFIIILICNIIWFFFAPAYRFGIFYNMLFVIMCSIPLWLFLGEKNLGFLIKYAKIVFTIVLIYFMFENITKVDWYLKRYEFWPPINNQKILERINY